MANFSSYRVRITALQRRLSALPYADEVCFAGCTESEVLDLEEYAGGDLPLAYKVFLGSMGKCCGHLFRGSVALLTQKYALCMKDVANRILSAAGSREALGTSAFVFCIHQGCQVLFFERAGDNPEVYIATHDEPPPKLLSSGFLEYLEAYVSDLEAIAKTNPHTLARRQRS